MCQSENRLWIWRGSIATYGDQNELQTCSGEQDSDTVPCDHSADSQPPRDPLNLQQVIIHHRLFCDDILCPGSKFLLPVDTNVKLCVQSPKRASTDKASYSLRGLRLWQELKSCRMWRFVAGRTVTGVSKDRGAFIFVVNHYKEDEDGGAMIFRSR
jgi:hypothetical protein